MRATLFALATILLAILLWCVFVYLLVALPRERARYAEALSVSAEEAVRSESATRVRAIIQDTEVERASLRSLLQVPVIDAVKVVEEAARAGGARQVSIGEVTPIAAKNPSPAAPPSTRVGMVVQVVGTFPVLVRVISLFETLTIPATLDSFDLENTDDGWRLTARLTTAVAQIQ
jgi:cbb3-type cytochrome oxidase subunit 3